MKKLLILLITFTFATELEVDGTLKVTGGIDAQGQPISNVGNPVNANDAIPMSAVGGVVSNMMSLSGSSPPERIYRIHRTDNNAPEAEYIVPINKIWEVMEAGYGGYWTFPNSSSPTDYGSDAGMSRNSGDAERYYLFPADRIYIGSNTSSSIHLTIFEYSFTSSGTSQGMDYVEP